MTGPTLKVEIKNFSKEKKLKAINRFHIRTFFANYLTLNWVKKIKYGTNWKAIKAHWKITVAEARSDYFANLLRAIAIDGDTALRKIINFSKFLRNPAAFVQQILTNLNEPLGRESTALRTWAM